MTPILFFFLLFVGAEATGRSFQSAIRKRVQSIDEIRARMVADRKAADAARSSTRAPQNNFYVADIYLGTPPQKFQMQLDTASSNLWVVDASCDSLNCNGELNWEFGYWEKHKFFQNRSTTFKKNGRSFDLWSFLGRVKGVLGADLADGLTVKNQGFALGTEIGDPFGEFPLDGVLGLGWPSLAVDQVTPPIQQLIQLLDQPLFTIWLDRQPETIGGTGGLITYGALDSTNCEAPLVYAPLTKEAFWQFDVDGFAVGTYSSTSKKSAISSTGTAFILAPADAFKQIINQTGVEYAVDCDEAAAFSDLVFTVGGQQLRVPSSEYVVYWVPQQKLCGLAIDWNMNENEYAWLLSDAFARTFCQIFDVGGERIGFAKARHADS